jgi:hypothetical protein
MTTTTRSISLFAFLMLSLATNADAARPAVESPFSTGACVFPTDVTDGMEDPNAWFAAAPNCRALCKKVEGQCKQLVGASFSCQMRWLAIIIGYDKKECEVAYAGNPAQIKTCKTGMDNVQKSGRLDISDGRDEALSACETWDTNCEGTCGPP